ncbi:type I-E CRISPR-associated protein Cas5/CasD [Vibrio parahaemolyticus]|uniref:type I-E CRISPR-associated protein Cas5/CasD n=1 Tax=Vibrio parahaemolyticus TaxID=670 RepID=UPI001EEBA68F|nr:type I-E CRISPR-associated protein Cas5/CasD [Vibrio parahaemolyticus]MCG6459617.1 type I-E CRISPR-associated protein Cas5/CasD [Vibrio parahaemolyticus]
MRPYLVFRLYGPMASWGEPAVGGDRHTGMMPSRSALLGLLGAALGIKRGNSAQLESLRQSVLFAIKQPTSGTLLRDYHTTQVAENKNKIHYHTRKQELDMGTLATVLSSRDYRCDGLWIIAVSLTKQSTFTLEQLQQALLKPTYPLCLGRKSCPLALPLMPKILTQSHLKQALDFPFPAITNSKKSDQYWLSGDSKHLVATYYWQGDKEWLDDVGENVVITTQPWDEPVSRSRWQFAPRVMHQVTLPISKDE